MRLNYLHKFYNNQIYSYASEGPKYSIPALKRYAEQNMGVVSIPAETLFHNLERREVDFEDSVPFRRYAIKANFNDPILVHKIDNEYWVISGLPTVLKASNLNKKYIKAYVFIGNLPAVAEINV